MSKSPSIYAIARKRGWTYSGDTNLEYGGLFWQWDGGPDYVAAIRVAPVSDSGGPDNVYEITRGSIYMPQDADNARALDVVGHTIVGPPELMTLVAAWEAYHGMDLDSYGGRAVVRIGKAEDANPNGWNPAPDVILPGNARLKNYVEREFLA